MGKKVLIVDDEVDVMKMLAYRLKAKGYQINTVTDGKDALKAVRDDRPDLIILDYRLPDMAGTEISLLLKKDDSFKKIPIILITASVDDIHQKAQECQAVDYIAKPIEPEELYSKVKKQIGE